MDCASKWNIETKQAAEQVSQSKARAKTKEESAGESESERDKKSESESESESESQRGFRWQTESLGHILFAFHLARLTVCFSGCSQYPVESKTVYPRETMFLTR